MSLIVADCPRCGASHMTLDVLAATFRFTEYSWKHWYEAYCVCRRCQKSAILMIGLTKTGTPFDEGASSFLSFSGSLNDLFEVRGPVTLKDNFIHQAPDFLPDDILSVYNEAVSCLSIRCYNAAATMFRLCLDLVTRPLLPDPEVEAAHRPNSKQRRDLGLRLQWLFEKSVLPESLKELSVCVREDANDGAHRGGLTGDDAEDLLDFCDALLERLITEPEKLKRASERRATRRNPGGT